jgi:hypothetical protein
VFPDESAFLVIQAIATEAARKDWASFASTEDQSSMVHACWLGAATRRGTLSIGLTADHFGISTVSITWIVPFVAAMSALTTVAPLINTLPFTTFIVID